VGRLLGADVLDVRALPGGRSSITLLATVAGIGPVVVKVAPDGLAPVGNRDVLRQAAVLHALDGVDGLAVPRVLATDAAAPPLFVMTHVAGDSFEPVNGDDELPPDAVLDGRARAAARMLARLHAVDPVAAGLGGEAVVTLDGEVERWHRALDTLDLDRLDGAHHEGADAFRQSMPEPVAPAVIHGDWRLGNMIAVGDAVAAVIDWEIWALGDPRVDLAWFLATSVFADNVFARRDPPGMPSRGELLTEYEDARGAAVADLDWFMALVAFKQAATVGLIAKHNRRAGHPDLTFEAAVPVLLSRARSPRGVRHG